MKAFNRTIITLLPFVWTAIAFMLFDRHDTFGGAMAGILVFHTTELLLYKIGIFKSTEQV
jgi:hypothetical protein